MEDERIQQLGADIKKFEDKVRRRLVPNPPPDLLLILPVLIDVKAAGFAWTDSGPGAATKQGTRTLPQHWMFKFLR